MSLASGGSCVKSSIDHFPFPDSKAIPTVHLTGAATATRRFLKRHIRPDYYCQTVRQPVEQPSRRRQRHSQRTLSGKALAVAGLAFRRQ